MINEELKNEVYDYWNEKSCGSRFSNKEKFSKDYFEEIENHRYLVEPEIFLFAQFTRYHGKKLLEVGVGAGTDFLQWVRAGTKAYGIDLTPLAIEHIRKRLEVYNLTAEDVRVGDCENIPYEENTFDIVYSYGVIHHTPDTEKALKEIIRVCRPGGVCKIMIYNRHSLTAFYHWIYNGLLKGRPWKSISQCLYDCAESKGTKAFTKKEIEDILKKMPVDSIRITSILTYYDKCENYNVILNIIAKSLAYILGGNRVGWFLHIQFNKKKGA